MKAALFGSQRNQEADNTDPAQGHQDLGKAQDVAHLVPRMSKMQCCVPLGGDVSFTNKGVIQPLRRCE